MYVCFTSTYVHVHTYTHTFRRPHTRPTVLDGLAGEVFVCVFGFVCVVVPLTSVAIESVATRVVNAASCWRGYWITWRFPNKEIFFVRVTEEWDDSGH